MLVVAAAAIGVLSGCQLADDGDNLVNGKVLFNEQCARCHTLARAGAKGVIGPNLDEAWQRAEQDGLARSYYKGLVYGQIQNPNRFRQVDPKTGKLLAAMPADLVKGDDARDVAAYVASAAARKGEDTGRLADVGGGPKGTAEAKNGTLDIPVGTGLNYKFADAEAPAGNITIDSKNAQPTGHNIAVDGNGVDEKGQVVQGGATSTVKVDLKPGEYAFYCSVPGHRAGGMEGKLTVK
jgi:plastocyanin